MRTTLSLLLALGLSSGAHAVPAFLQMYKAQYHPAVASCLLCHQDHAGGRLNDYGEAFVKAGATFEAFKALEGKDSDGDGATNLQEILAGSNPGDESSTPKKPGTWLTAVEPGDTIPFKALGRMFPGIERYEIKEVALTDADAKAVGDALGGPALTPADRLWTLYFPVNHQVTPPVRIGVAVFPAAALPDGLFLGGVALGSDGKVCAAWGEISTALGGDKLKELAAQVVGKSATDPLTVGKDLTAPKGKAAESAAGAREFRKAVLVVTRLLGAG